MRSLLVVLWVASACIEPNEQPCGDLSCPAGTVCVAGSRCVTQAQVVACVGATDGTACTADELTGSCVGGACIIESCGNGILEPGEVCDDGNRISGDGCSSDCRSNETCGNGIVDVGETCDCGSTAADQPAYCTHVNSTDPAAECDPSCSRRCGDGMLTGAEQCDGAAIPYTCASFGYYDGALACTAVCTIDATGCSGKCGDGVVQTIEGEICDGAPPAGDTCVGFGFDEGALACSALCGPALTSCESFGWQILIPPVSELLDADANQHGVIAVRAVDNAAFGNWDGAAFTRGTTYQFALASATWIGAASDTTLSTFDGTTWTDVAVPAPAVAMAALAAGDVYALRDDCNVDHYTTTWASLPAVPDFGCLALLVVSTTEIYVSTTDDNDNESGTVWSFDGMTWNQLTIPGDDFMTAIGKRAHGLLLGNSDGAVQLPEGTLLSSQYTWGFAGRGQIAFGAGDNEPYFMLGNSEIDLPWIDNDPDGGFTHGARLTTSGDILAWGNGVYKLHDTWIVYPITPGQGVTTSVGDDGRVWSCDDSVTLLDPAQNGSQSFPALSGPARCRKVIGTPTDVIALTDVGPLHSGGGTWAEYGDDSNAYDGWYDVANGALYMLVQPDDDTTGVVARAGTDTMDLGAPACEWASVRGYAGHPYISGTCSNLAAVYSYDGSTWTALPRPFTPFAGFYVAPDGEVFGVDGQFAWRFDGTQWVQIATTTATQIAGVSATEVYIAGDLHDHDADVIFRWDGTQMSPIRLPSSGPIYSIDATAGALAVHRDSEVDVLVKVAD